jgi:hypothetical protein
MIPLIEEPKEIYKEFRTYEFCYFKCGNRTKFWHAKTNQPICKDCAKTRKVAEVEKSSPSYKPVSIKEYSNN